MISLNQYLLESSVCLALFYSFYHLFLRRETFFQLNRFYLLLTPALSLSIPLLNISLRKADETVPYFYPIVAQADNWNQRLWETMETQPTPLFTFTVGDLLLVLYGIGVFFMLQKLFQSLWQVGQIIRRSRRIASNDFTVVETESDLPAASFFSFVFWKGGQLSERQRLILEHELVHVRQKHSFDVLLMELWVILKWFNPLIYLFRRSLRITHEYIADRYVAQKSGSKSAYAQLLVQQGQANSCLSLVNTFSFLTKKRLLMLSRRPSPNWQYAKYFLSLPLLLALLTLFSFNLTDNLPEGVKAPFQDAGVALGELSRKELITIENQQAEKVPGWYVEHFFAQLPISDSTVFFLNGQNVESFDAPVAIFEEDIINVTTQPLTLNPPTVEITTKNQYNNVHPFQVKWGEISFDVPQKIGQFKHDKLHVYKKTQQHTVTETMVQHALTQPLCYVFENAKLIPQPDYDLMYIPADGTPQPKWVNQPKKEYKQEISQQLQPHDVLEFRKFLPENIGIYVFLKVMSDEDYEIKGRMRQLSIPNNPLVLEETGGFDYRMTKEEFIAKLQNNALIVEHWGKSKKVEGARAFVRVPKRGNAETRQIYGSSLRFSELLQKSEGFQKVEVGDIYYFEGVKLEGEDNLISLAFKIVEHSDQQETSRTGNRLQNGKRGFSFQKTAEEFKSNMLTDALVVEHWGMRKKVEQVENFVRVPWRKDVTEVHFPNKTIGATDMEGAYGKLVHQATAGDIYYFEGVKLEGEREAVSLSFKITGNDYNLEVEELADTINSFTTDGYIQVLKLTPEKFKKQLSNKPISNGTAQASDVEFVIHQQKSGLAGKLYFRDYKQDIGNNGYNDLIQKAQIGDTYIFDNVAIPGKQQKGVFIYNIVDKQELSEQPNKTLNSINTNSVQISGGSIKIDPAKQGEPKPLYVLDSKIIDAEKLNELDATTIASVTVFKNEDATAKYGDKAKHGVVEIVTKGAKSQVTPKSANELIKGKVVDEQGNPLIGATVIVTGISVGTVTDFHGEFSLEVPAEHSSLTVAYIGFATKTVPIQDAEQPLRIELQKEEGEEQLRPNEALYRIKIDSTRSTNMFSGNANILFIIDGKEADTETLNELSPDSIKSIDVLKNEKAVAIYGEKGKNGVIIISTKSKAQ